MRELAQRELLDGSRTTITLYLADDAKLIVEATNANGTSSAEAPAHEALHWYQHPFCNAERLDYPTRDNAELRTRPLSVDEYALLEALTQHEV